MTSTTHRRHPHGAQPIVPATVQDGAVRPVAATLARFGRWLGAGTVKFRSSGQLGPGAEKEAGRSTGGRI